MNFLKKDYRISQFFQYGVGSVLLRLFNVILVFGITIILARTLGSSGYGVYAYVLSVISIISIPAEFGLPNLVVRETTKSFTRQEWGVIQGVWRWSSKISIIINVILLVSVGLILFVVQYRLSGAHTTTFFWGIFLPPLITLGNLRGAALRGLKWMILGQFPEQVLRPLFFCLLILAVVLIFPIETFKPFTAMALNVVASFFSFVLGGYILWKATPVEVRQAKPIYNTSHWLKSTLPLAFISGTGVINSYTSIIILGMFVTSAEVGLYRIADQMALLASISLQAINLVISPQFTHLHTVGDKFGLQRLATISARIVLLFTLPVALTFLFFGKPILHLIFGVDFVSAYFPLLILVVGQLINSAMGSVGFLLIMTGNEQDAAQGMAIAAIINIILNFLFVPQYGINGAAFSSAISLITWNVLLWFLVRKKIGINSTAFYPIQKG